MVLRTPARRPAAKPGSAATFLFRTLEFVSRPDAVEACEQAIETLVARADRQHGTRFVASFRDADDPHHYMLTLVFEDERAEREHDASLDAERFRTVIEAAAADGVRARTWEAGQGV